MAKGLLLLARCIIQAYTSSELLKRMRCSTETKERRRSNYVIKYRGGVFKISRLSLSTSMIPRHHNTPWTRTRTGLMMHPQLTQEHTATPSSTGNGNASPLDTPM